MKSRTGEMRNAPDKDTIDEWYNRTTTEYLAP